MNPITQKLVAAASALAVLAGIYGFIHHQGAKSEEAKIEKHSTAVIEKVQENKNEIRNRNADDDYSIKRLLSGSF